MLKNTYDMNPLLVCVTDPFTHTDAGTHNYTNIEKVFGCDKITLMLNPNFIKKTTIATFKALGSTNWALDKAIYAWPLQVAIEKKIKLIIYGENVAWEYGGVNAEDTYNANTQIFNDVVKASGENIVRSIDPTGKNSNALRYPSTNEIKNAQIQSIYLSYFFPWNDLKNVEVATIHGFRTLGREWQRQGFIDDYAQIDSIGYLFNYYMKYLKYNIGRVVDIGSRWIRYGTITKSELATHIDNNEGLLDVKIFEDFKDFTGLTADEIFEIAENFVCQDSLSKFNEMKAEFL
jgi:hypothetical protein